MRDIAVGNGRIVSIGAKAEHMPEAVVAVPGCRAIYREGRLVAKDGEVIS